MFSMSGGSDRLKRRFSRQTENTNNESWKVAFSLLKIAMQVAFGVFPTKVKNI